MSSSGCSSWHVTTISVLAGLGAGYLIGVLTGKWLLQRRRGRGRAQGHPSRQSYEHLVAVLSTLTSEVGDLQRAISEIQNRQELRLSSVRGAESVVSEFVSAHGSDDEFFDWNSEKEDVDRETPSSTVNMEYLDQLGMATLESEEVCHNLIGELNRQLEGSPDDPLFLWRLSRGLVHLSMHCEQKGELEEEKQLLIKAAEHAQKALELDDSVWQSHQWFAIAVGSQAKHEGTQRRITAGHEYKEHIDAAISLNPNDPNLFHLRGRWAFEVSGLSWLEKKAAATLFATPPSSTFTEALEDFLKVETLNAGAWKSNMMFIAKCHIKLGDFSSAMDWIHKSLQLKVLTTEDKTAQNELYELMATCDAELNYS